MRLGPNVQKMHRVRARERTHDALGLLPDLRGLGFDLVGERRCAREQVRKSDRARGLSRTISPERPWRKG